MTWVELDGGVCYELGDDSFLLLRCPATQPKGFQPRIRPHQTRETAKGNTEATALPPNISSSGR